MRSIPADHRDDGDHAILSLGRILVNWGGMLKTLNRFEESVARSDSGLRLVEPYLQLEPNDALAREVGLRLHGNRALARSELGRHRESVNDWVRVVELSARPVPPDYHIQLAIELVQAGELDRASAQARLAQAASDLSGLDRYNLCSYFAVCAVAARNDTTVPPDQRSRMAESRISEAFHWLRRAAEAGFFRDRDMLKEVQKDPHVEILRDRPEFRQLIGSADTRP